MPTNIISAVVLNPTSELESFPLTQTLKIEFNEQLEDSQLANCISLVRNNSTQGLFNLSDKYNQTIGYVKEKFELEDIDISTVITNNKTVLSVTPKKPLNPGFSYTFFVDKKLSKEYLTITKPISKSNSSITFSPTTNSSLDLLIDIVSKPNLKLGNKVTLKITNQITSEIISKSIDLDLKKDLILPFGTITLPSNVYLEGEQFKIVTSNTYSLLENLFITIKASSDSNIQPIATNQQSTSLSNQDILNFYQSKESQNTTVTSDCTVEYIGNDKFIVVLPEGYTTNDLDLDNVKYSLSEAFGMYLLTDLSMYTPGLTYDIRFVVKDSRTLIVYNHSATGTGGSGHVHDNKAVLDLLDLDAQNNLTVEGGYIRVAFETTDW